MRLTVVAAALGLGLVTTTVAAQAPRQIQIFAGVLHSTGAPAKSLDISDVHLKEDGADATVTRVERVDWPVKLQLLLDNGVGLGGGSIQPLKAGVQGLLAALPGNLEVTIVGTAPQPRFLTRATTDRAAMQQGLDLLASERVPERSSRALPRPTNPSIVIRPTPSSHHQRGHDLGRSRHERVKRRSNGSWRGSRPARRRCMSCSTPVARKGRALAPISSTWGSSVTKYTGGTYDKINNATRMASLLPEIGEKVAAAVERHRRQFRITA